MARRGDSRDIESSMRASLPMTTRKLPATTPLSMIWRAASDAVVRLPADAAASALQPGMAAPEFSAMWVATPPEKTTDTATGLPLSSAYSASVSSMTAALLAP